MASQNSGMLSRLLPDGNQWRKLIRDPFLVYREPGLTELYHHVHQFDARSNRRSRTPPT
jgi:hypothetical protein